MNWWVWGYPTIWVPVLCASLGVVRALVLVGLDRSVGRVASLQELTQIYDALNEIAEAPHVHRACVLRAHNGVLLSKMTRVRISMLAEVTNQGPARRDWQSQLANSTYVQHLADLCRDGQVVFDRDKLPDGSLLRSQWETERTAGSDVYLLKIQRWSLGWAILGRIGIRAIYYLSVNVATFDKTAHDVVSINHGVESIKRIYKR